MPDKFDKKTRSKIMSKIKSKNTLLELEFRNLLWKSGLGGYRVYYNLPGKPDITYVAKKIVVFIDGDFWHGYNWKRLGRIPPKDYWQGKIEKNTRLLGKNGWKVLRFWEHEIKHSPKKCIGKIKAALAKQKEF